MKMNACIRHCLSAKVRTFIWKNSSEIYEQMLWISDFEKGYKIPGKTPLVELFLVKYSKQKRTRY